jgi:hypothetical protein
MKSNYVLRIILEEIEPITGKYLVNNEQYVLREEFDNDQAFIETASEAVGSVWEDR